MKASSSLFPTATSQEIGISINIDEVSQGTVDLFNPDLYEPGNDLELWIMAADGSNPNNLTNNVANDEMLLIGDEVSWFCGLKRNLAECTYFPKIMTIESLRLMAESQTVLPETYPSRDLYPVYYAELDAFMSSNPLRPQNASYWAGVLQKKDDPSGSHDEELVVLPAPVQFRVDNQPPTPVLCGDYVEGEHGSSLDWSSCGSTDPDGDRVTYDVYVGKTDPPLTIMAKDITTTGVIIGGGYLERLTQYHWKVVAKDNRDGMQDGPVWSFSTGSTLVTLSSFTAEGSDGEVVLEWVTASEIDNAGFNLWRSAKKEKGEYVQINPTLIPAKGNPTQGATYTFTDTGVRNGVRYFYKLEDVDLQGVSTLHGKGACTFGEHLRCKPVQARPHRKRARR